MAYVSRDPFARQETHRTRVPGVCAFCGQVDPLTVAYLGNKSELAARPQHKTYRYKVETDGGRVYEDRDVFCGSECRKAYR